MLRLKNTQWMAMLLLLWGTGALADDVKIRPAAGNGVVVTNAAGTSERLRVNESGQVFLPALTPLSSNQILCFDSATGRIGTCSQLAPIRSSWCATLSSSSATIQPLTALSLEMCSATRRARALRTAIPTNTA